MIKAFSCQAPSQIFGYYYMVLLIVLVFSTRHCWQMEIPSLLGFFQAFWIISSYFRNDKREVQAGPGQAGGPVWATAVKCGIHWLSGAKRSPETLLEINLQINVLGTWNWIKVNKTCPSRLRFNLEEIYAVTKKLLSNSPFWYCHW